MPSTLSPFGIAPEALTSIVLSPAWDRRRPAGTVPKVLCHRRYRRRPAGPVPGVLCHRRDRRRPAGTVPKVLCHTRDRRRPAGCSAFLHHGTAPSPGLGASRQPRFDRVVLDVVPAGVEVPPPPDVPVVVLPEPEVAVAAQQLVGLWAAGTAAVPGRGRAAGTAAVPGRGRAAGTAAVPGRGRAAGTATAGHKGPTEADSGLHLQHGGKFPPVLGEQEGSSEVSCTRISLPLDISAWPEYRCLTSW